MTTTTYAPDQLLLWVVSDDDGITVSDTLIERFWQHVDKRGLDECWPWIGALTSGNPKRSFPGYGTLHYGMKNGRQVQIYAHHLSWMIHSECPIPKGMCICHHCDNGPCVNPKHLFCGTFKDNTQDMIAKGRKAGPWKMTPQMIADAKRMYRVDGLSTPEIARQFSVSPNTISYHIQDCVLPGHLHNPGSKLTKQAVTSICQRYAFGNTSLSILAREYGVDPSYISLLVNGKRRVTITSPVSA